MQEESRFTILPKITIRPNKVTFYNQFFKNNVHEPVSKQKTNPATKEFLCSIGAISSTMPISNKHNFEISKKASGRIKEKITWLYHLSKSQTITTHNNKVLSGFKMSFITLTLPSAQKHTSAQITKECLNQFITELGQRFNLRNYVWRLEFQKNGNAHYHIATDCFIEYWQARTIWNRCIEKLGYVSEYTKNNTGLTFNDYLKRNPITEKNTFEILKARFTQGCATRWSQPNSVDVRCVTNHKNISFYISKYITKNDSEGVNPIVKTREEINTNLRLWFCSRSLSRLDKISYFEENLPSLHAKCLSIMKEVKIMLYDYCEVWYFNIKDQHNEFKALFREVLYEYARECSYFNTKDTRQNEPERAQVVSVLV
jgi:hypothetical protein